MLNKEFLIPLVVLILSYAFLDPLMLLMPTPMVYSAMALLFIGYVAFSLLVWRERALDEREHAHRAGAARLAYLAGTGTLVIGIIYQALTVHAVDPWLILTLTLMVLAKYVGRHYAELYN